MTGADVSRETDGLRRASSRPVSTPPSTPPAAREAFAPERLDRAERYCRLLADAGVTRGLIGPREAPRLWERHLLNCAALAAMIPEHARVCDIGSGAGLPGLVLAIARPDLHVTLLEPLLRRTTFLTEAVDELDLGRQVTVDRGRAEDRGGHAFDVVTSRAVAPLTRLLAWSMPLVAPTGALLAMKGASVHEEVRAAEDVLTTLGCGTPEVVVLSEPWLTEETCVVRVAWADPGQVGWRPASSSRRGKRSRGGAR